MDNSNVWISQKMFSYQNPDTSVMLNIMLESGIFEDDYTHRSSYYPPRVALQIYDGRVQSSRVQVELQFAEMNKLIESIDALFTKDRNKIFSANSVISITRFWQKAHKTVTLLFGIKNKKAMIEVKLTDPTTGEKVISLDWAAYTGMYNFIKQVRDSYALISSNILTVAMQERMVERMGVLSSNMSQLRSQIHNPKEENVETDIPLETPKVESTVASQFNKAIDIDKIELEAPKELTAPKEKKDIEHSPMPFIGTFLNYDPMRLCNWVSAFLCSNEKSESSMFAALDSVLVGSNINATYNSSLMNDAQYYMNVMFRKGVKSFLETNKFISFKIPKILTLDVPNMQEMCAEIAFTCMTFMVISNSYLKKIKDDALQTNSDFMKIRIASYFLNRMLMPFIISIPDPTLLSEDILSVLDKCRKNGFLDKLDDIYGGLVAGGKFNFSDAVATNQIKGFIVGVENGVDSFDLSLGINDPCKSYDIPVFSGIKDVDEIKTCVLAALNIQEPIVKSDERIGLFLECIKKHADEMVIEKIKASCSKYSELEVFLRGSNVDDMVLQIKRVMDADKSLNRRTDILKAAKSIVEDPAVTETRVMFEKDVKENDDGIQMSEDLESVLFGTES